MDKNEAKIRIEKLKTEINKYRYTYHVLDKSIISDETLDSLKKELFDLENQFPEFITLDSPTQRVGGEPLREFKKVTHREPRMTSLNDAFSEEDLLDWLERLKNYLGHNLSPKIYHLKPEFYCDLKMDGLAVELVYENGIFIQGSTRGDGLIGEDITLNLKTIDAIPLKLNLQPTTYNLQPNLVVRGEVFLTKKEFARINREQAKIGDKPYSNPRNVAAGSLRQLDPKITASRKLDFFAYDIVGDSNEVIQKYPTKELEYKALNEFGFKTNPFGQAFKSLEEIIEFQKKWSKEREKLPYEIDGVVISVNDNLVFKEAGIIGKAPRAAVAFKFSPREATTQVKKIKVQVGRTGALTPVAVLEPVGVGGITITHASLHNEDEIKRLDLRVGDTVIVSRAGDVIPQITQVLKNLRTGREKKFEMPNTCPVDGSKVIKEGAITRCSNKNCVAKLRESLYHFVSRGAFNMEGLGPKIIDRFLDEGLISDAADIFTLKKEDIEILDRFGEKSAENIIGEIELRKKITLPRFIYALGILHIGEETSQLLAKQIIAKFSAEGGSSSGGNIEHLLKILQNYSSEDFQKIKDIGPKVAKSIYDWFHDSKNIAFLKKLYKVGINIEIPNTYNLKPNTSISGKIFVLTGSLSAMSRNDAKEKIRAHGGEISESVSKETDYVITGKNPGSKLEKAKKIGVKILSETDFLNLIVQK